MNRKILAGALALALFLAAPMAMAATTTTTVALSNTSYTDLGPGPILLGATGGSIVYQVADSQPSASSAGLVQQFGSAPALLQTTAHVWAISSGGTAIVSAGTGVGSVYDVSNAIHAPGYCQITVTTSSQTLTAMLATAAGLSAGGSCAAPTWATWAYFRPATAGTSVIRCTADGFVPTASLGFPLDGLTDFPMAGGVSGGAPFSTIKCISPSGSVLVDIQWMG